MNIALLAADSTYPNLALMKISAYHKNRGDNVSWYNHFDCYDKLYISKVFTFTPDYGYVIANVGGNIFRGGTGYSLDIALPDEVDRLQPDYSLYPSIDSKTAYGFLTRGCIRKCKWCVVPRKEGTIRPYMDIEEIAIDGRDNVILMDNNVLASDYWLGQIEKIIRMKLKVDFNQALDARLVNKDIARMLAKVRWIKRIRFGCDTPQQISECENAIQLIRQAGYKGEFFLYCILLDDLTESYSRVAHWRKDRKVLPFCQPYRNLDGKSQAIPQWQKDLTRWADRKELFMSMDFKDYEPRKGFKCKEYFKKTYNI